MPIALVLTLYFRADRNTFNSAAFAILLCFYLSYIGYLLVPAVGPRFTLSHVQTADIRADPATLWVRQTLDGLEHNKTDAFPSGHTAVALVTLVYAWKYRERVLFLILAPAVLALIFSTVYLRYHYVVDVIAGILLAALTVVIAPMAHRLFSGSSDHPQS
jgi:membrane-associated phospholipid phosphatase